MSLAIAARTHRQTDRQADGGTDSVIASLARLKIECIKQVLSENIGTTIVIIGGMDKSPPPADCTILHYFYGRESIQYASSNNRSE